MITINDTIIAEHGVLRRVSTKELLSKEYTIGMLYFLDGKRLDPPHKEEFSEFEEVTKDQYFEENLERYTELVESKIRERYSLCEELAIQRQRDSNKERFNEYFDFCERCKKDAKDLILSEFPEV